MTVQKRKEQIVDIKGIQSHFIHGIAAQIRLTQIGGETPRRPHHRKAHKGLILYNVTHHFTESQALRRCSIDFFAESEANHVRHANQAADDKDYHVPVLRWQGVQEPGCQKSKAQVKACYDGITQ